MTLLAGKAIHRPCRRAGGVPRCHHLRWRPSIAAAGGEAGARGPPFQDRRQGAAAGGRHQSGRTAKAVAGHGGGGGRRWRWRGGHVPRRSCAGRGGGRRRALPRPAGPPEEAIHLHRRRGRGSHPSPPLSKDGPPEQGSTAGGLRTSPSSKLGGGGVFINAEPGGQVVHRSHGQGGEAVSTGRVGIPYSLRGPAHPTEKHDDATVSQKALLRLSGGWATAVRRVERESLPLTKVKSGSVGAVTPRERGELLPKFRFWQQFPSHEARP